MHILKALATHASKNIGHPYIIEGTCFKNCPVATFFILKPASPLEPSVEGMRVLYDAHAKQYVVSHTVQMQHGAPGTFEFGMSAFSLDGKQKWIRAFPAQSGNLKGVHFFIP